MKRQYLASLTALGAGEALELEPLPDAPDIAGDRMPWINRWEFERGGKRFRVRVIVTLSVAAKVIVENAAGEVVEEKEGQRVDAHIATIDARDWIETFGDRERWPEGARFHLVMQEVSNGG